MKCLADEDKLYTYTHTRTSITKMWYGVKDHIVCLLNINICETQTKTFYKPEKDQRLLTHISTTNPFLTDPITVNCTERKWALKVVFLSLVDFLTE